MSCGNIAHHKTMLLRNIKDEKNKDISDHMWITLKDFQSGMKFRRNKLVKITGEVIKYRGFDGANFAIDPEIIEI